LPEGQSYVAHHDGLGVAVLGGRPSGQVGDAAPGKLLRHAWNLAGDGRPVPLLPVVSGELEMTGKAVLVTGGSRGIGRGIAERFLQAGADVVICGRNQPDSLPAKAVFVAADVREPDQVDALVGTTVDRLGRLDVLVNNAGGSPTADTATA